MRIVFISDTHNQHYLLSNLPKGDMIIHSGDLTSVGTPQEVDSFLNWFISLEYQHKIFIAGNHDFCFENAKIEDVNSILPNNVHYLCNSGIEIEGVKIYGSPITPFFNNWAFNVARGEKIRKYWEKIPENTDVLITHGAPFGILDRTIRNVNTGCEDLLEIVKKVKPKFHLFGHIHEHYGESKNLNTTFFNGSILDENYRMKNEAIEFEID